MVAPSSHPFLSPAWIDAARGLHDEFGDQVTAPNEPVRMNVTVINAPFSQTEVLGHLDTTHGSTIPESGHLENPDVAVRVPYSVARQLLVERQYDNVMIAFMSGEIEVAGDVSMLMALQDLDPTPEQRALAEQIAERLHQITE